MDQVEGTDLIRRAQKKVLSYFFFGFGLVSGGSL